MLKNHDPTLEVVGLGEVRDLALPHDEWDEERI
jgi:hypothetical protein